jgi:transposase
VGKKKERRSFDREFKNRVVRLLTEGDRKVSDVAKDLNIHPNVINRWKREYIEDREHAALDKDYTKSGEEIELQKLKKRLAYVMEERDILKKALAIISNRHK